MSRFMEGDSENPCVHLWDSYVKRGIACKKGQAALKTFEKALLAMPNKRLIQNDLARDGEVCAIGALSIYSHPEEERAERLQQLSYLDGQEDSIITGQKCGLSYSLSWEIGYLNDDVCENMTDEARYTAVLGWVQSKINRPGTTPEVAEEGA